MHCPLRCLAGLVVLFCGSNTLAAAVAPEVSSPGPSPAEVITVAKVFAAAHYARERVKPEDATRDVIRGMMQGLDPDFVVFEPGDLPALVEASEKDGGEYRKANVTGDLSTAQKVYGVFRQRWEQRCEVIRSLLEKPLTAAGEFPPNGRRQDWAGDGGENYWRARLRYELNVALLRGGEDAAARQELRSHYDALLANVRAFPAKDITELYLDAFVRRYDPRSAYYSRESYTDFSADLQALTGVGIQFEAISPTWIVQHVASDGPAAGVLFPHDRITHVGSVDVSPSDVAALSNQAMSRLTRGEPGSTVAITFLPDGLAAAPEARTAVLTRARGNLANTRARAAIFTVAQPGAASCRVGVIRLPALYSQLPPEGGSGTASRDTAAFLRAFADVGVNGVILDLRHNGGGYLNEAIDVVGLFVPDKPIVTVRNYDGQLTVSTAEKSEDTHGGPLIVLVDSQTSSGAEIIAGALQDHGRAIVIGEGPTHGLGTVQQVIELNQIARGLQGKASGAVKLTVQRFFLPSGRSTHLRGVTPDLTIRGIDDPREVREKATPAIADETIEPVLGAPKPFDAVVLARLRLESQARQRDLPEFTWLRRRQDALKAGVVPLEQDGWRAFLRSKSQVRANLNKERKELTVSAFHFDRVPLPNLPDASPVKNHDDPSRIDPSDYSDFAGFDVPLREALRVLCGMVGAARTDKLKTVEKPGP